MDEIQFHYNNKIEIDTEEGFYKSSIQEIGDDYIGISIPVLEGKYLTLPTDKEVHVLYYLEKDVYNFTTTVVGTKIDKILIIVLRKPKSYLKMQRRNYARAATLENVSYAVKDGAEHKYHDALMLDLSGGGARIHVKNKLRYGEVIIICVPLKDESITVKAQVIRIDSQRDNESTVGLSFIDVDKTNREKIIKHVFNVMREQMQRSSKGE